ncbi:hypothetical protein PHLGIDRAFT_11472 [Phlebiopsis gigantea 11061_1 CR5-6]|uniref:Borealin N-terminal domain-containing protein n=1 Tax=Phlebiopsis gigantea (strain 11061_1 CR5-6) TaxID=745531 RepID=A0A0C3PSB5_PHLG1|nr:hypothetical protein PHLGIDRAFT_11472 [Phlebiopsis gigantea 11061_1 CR5-6]
MYASAAHSPQTAEARWHAYKQHVLAFKDVMSQKSCRLEENKRYTNYSQAKSEYRSLVPRMKKYTAEEKAQLLANLDLEVSHRARQFEEWLADALENFRMHQEALISRVPRLVRDITLREFAKYNGDIQACLKGVQREKLGGEAEAIDKNTRKRKWVESQEVEGKAGDTSGTEPPKAAKTGECPQIASIHPSSTSPFISTYNDRDSQEKSGPLDYVGYWSARATPYHEDTRDSPSPGPHKPLAKPVPFPRPGSRPASPSKIPSTTSPSKPSRPTNGRIPSAAHFNPHIPASSSSSYPRWPRKDEHMLSVNGSPLANPLRLGLDLSGWLSKVVETGFREDSNTSGHNRPNSIIVRTASSSESTTGAPSHQRTTSQAGIAGPSQSTTHSRTNSASNLNGRINHAFVPTRSGTTSQPASQPTQPSTPSPSTSPRIASLPLHLAALVAVPTADGHLLEFDPFQTSPGEIDALDISDNAKQQAKDDMRKLVAHAMDRWKIT